MRNRTYILLFCLLIATTSYSQTFSYRYHLGFPHTVFCNVLPTDNGFIVTGIGSDSVPPYKTGALFSYFTKDGIPEYSKLTVDQNQSFETWSNDLFVNEEGNLVTSGYGADSTGNYSFLLVYSSIGDTLLSKRFYSPLFPESPFIVPNAGILPYLNGYLMQFAVGNHESVPFSNDLYLIRLDQNFDTIWTNLYVSPQNDFVRSVVIDDEERIIVGSNQNNLNIDDNNFTGRLHLMRIDSNGVVLNNFYFPEDYDFFMWSADAMILAEDGGLIIASQFGEEYIVNPNAGQLRFISNVLKVNTTLSEVEWIRPFTFNGLYSTVNGFKEIISTSDGAGYICVGVENVEGGSIAGTVGKFSEQGDSIWLRNYQIVETASNRHELRDVAETKDGGFVLVGQSSNYVIDTSNLVPIQQGWIMKVDEYGCLVPGCQLTSSIDEVSTPFSPDVRVYPNPANEFLHVFYQTTPGVPLGAVQFRIVDVLGREVTRFETNQSEMSFVLDVSGWVSGFYFLVAENQNGAKINRRIVIEH
ncbi:MAG: T9SS type A sorting domain-containing protein [Saprospiraceae bacterium]|nr:T9SS type A sorting domain-containing protein [Saprospiraceae bacterium]